MRRRTKAGGKPAKARCRKPATPERRHAPKAAPRRRSSAAGSETEVARLTRELRDALEQQTATSQVLSVISSSPGALEPVFQAMLDNAVRICEAKFGVMFRFDGDVYDSIATLNLPPAVEEFLRHRGRRKPTLGSDLDKLLSSKAVIQTPDMEKSSNPSRIASLAGVRTQLAVPLLRDDVLVGAINIYRQEVRPFTDKQIALVQNFAAQAVIAIENAQLLSELRESLEQQTATSEVLSVISTSPGELKPVFQAMLENAVRICDARFGTLYRFDGEAFTLAAGIGTPPALAEFNQRRGPFQPLSGSTLDHVTRTKQVHHTADDKAAPVPSPSARLGGARSLVTVPMLKDDALIGAITIYRQEVRPFTDKQIALVQNFANQAVIAIENTRLLSELRESLEQQTATSDVLRVISASPGELEPVFQAMLANATRICEANFGSMALLEGKVLRRVAIHNAPSEFVEFHGKSPVFDTTVSATVNQLVTTKQLVHTADLLEKDPGSPLAKYAGARTLILVPLLKDDELVGVIGIYRQDVRPFTDKQIALVQNFAAQAVIAIENTRLLNELRQRTTDLTESLEQQAATSEVLNVISRSKFDLQPILQSVVDTAARLCRADTAVIFRLDQNMYRFAAGYCLDPQYMEIERATPIAPGPGTVVGRAAMRREVVRITDAMEDPLYDKKGDAAVAQVRSMMGVPLMREGQPIGVIALARQRVEPFVDREIELVSTFADQAAIAIENVRLFESVEARTRELARSLEDLRTAQDRLVQTEKLASLGQLTAGIAHEIKNPLNFVNNFAGVSVELIDELKETLAAVKADDKTQADIADVMETLRGNLEKIVQHGKRADSIVKNMLLHSREGSGEHRPVDVNALVEESLNLAYHGARAEKEGFNITLERSFDPAAGEVDLFPQEITRVLLNLISNGFYAATKRKGEAGDKDFEPVLAAATKNLGDGVEIKIRDNGTGIPAEVKAKMFNPFFTTKPAGEGTGLGLSISHDIIVKQHGGSIAVDTEPGKFTEFRIVLPREAASIAKTPDDEPGEQA
jgi:two-component system NtrC family sensor kinase